MTLTLYFLRHGQTELSRGDLFCGSGLDPKLTHEGQEMAEAFEIAYRDTPWSSIFCSNLQRCITTAQPLCESLGMKLEIREDLKEIGYGKWEGLTKAAVEKDYHDDYLRWLSDPAWNAPTGGELATEVEQRGLRAIKEITSGCDDGNVLVVSHKATIRIILCSLLGIEAGRFRQRLGCPVGSVSIVEFATHGPMLQVLADRSHLTAALRSLPGT